MNAEYTLKKSTSGILAYWDAIFSEGRAVSGREEAALSAINCRRVGFKCMQRKRRINQNGLLIAKSITQIYPFLRKMSFCIQCDKEEIPIF
jgi:hypothetical protein